MIHCFGVVVIRGVNRLCGEPEGLSDIEDQELQEPFLALNAIGRLQVVACDLEAHPGGMVCSYSYDIKAKLCDILLKYMCCIRIQLLWRFWVHLCEPLMVQVSYSCVLFVLFYSGGSRFAFLLSTAQLLHCGTGARVCSRCAAAKSSCGWSGHSPQ